MLTKVAPARIVAKLVTQDLSLNRTALNMLTRSGVLSKNTLQKIALKVIKNYKQTYKAERQDGETVADATESALNDRLLMVQRIQDATVNAIANEIKDQYRGEFYRWLPSEAETPDPIHALNYGKKFQIGKGEMPGDRYGCKCGMEILTSDTKLDL